MALKIAIKAVAIRGCRNGTGKNMRADKKNSRGGRYKTRVQDETELFYPDKKNEFF